MSYKTLCLVPYTLLRSLLGKYLIHWNNGQWAVMFQRPIFHLQRPMGCTLFGWGVNRVFF